MKIKWLGQASFLITTNAGTKIITDPYTPGGNLKYGEIKESADVVTVSHNHGDHNNVAAISGNPRVVREAGSVEIKRIKINGVPSYHDSTKGSQRGNNIIFCFETEGIRVCHLGDLGHPLGDSEVAALGKIDVLLIPVGSFYTIDAPTATEVCNRLAPKVVIPMHYKNERCSAPISGVDDFLQGKKGVNKPNSSETEVQQGKLPATAQIIVLPPAL